MSLDHSQVLTNQTLKSVISRAYTNNELFRKRFDEQFNQLTVEELSVKSSAIDNGISNKIFIIEISNNIDNSSTMELILKITNHKSNSFNKTLNEAVIMKFLHDYIPDFKSPALYDHTDGNGHDELGMDYILMEKCTGVALNLIYDELKEEERQSLISQISKMRSVLSEFRFIPQDNQGNIKECLFGSVLNIKVESERVAQVIVGSNSDGDGPFESFTEFLIANFVKRIEDMQQDETVSSQVGNFENLVKYLKENPVSMNTDLYQLCHIDLTPNNVIVDPSTNQITGIIDWEWGVMTLLDMDINELLTWTRNDEEIKILKDCLNRNMPQISSNPTSFWQEYEERRKFFLALDWAIRLSSYKSWFKETSEADQFVMKALENTSQFFKDNKF